MSKGPWDTLRDAVTKKERGEPLTGLEQLMWDKAQEASSYAWQQLWERGSSEGLGALPTYEGSKKDWAFIGALEE